MFHLSPFVPWAEKNYSPLGIWAEKRLASDVPWTMFLGSFFSGFGVGVVVGDFFWFWFRGGRWWFFFGFGVRVVVGGSFWFWCQGGRRWLFLVLASGGRR